MRLEIKREVHYLSDKYTTKMSSRIKKLSFSCNEDWNKMDPTERGKFCSRCQKEIFDYSKMNKDQFEEKLASNEITCGRFRIDQVDADIISEIKVPVFVKRISLAASLVLITDISQAQIPDTTRIEQIDTSLDPESGETIDNIEEERPWYVKKNGKIKRPFISTRRTSWYFVRKFPFIKREFHHIMGF